MSYFLSSITPQFRSFMHWIVFDLFFSLQRDSENDLFSVHMAWYKYGIYGCLRYLIR